MADRSKNVQSTPAVTPLKQKGPATAFDPIAAALQQIHSRVTDENVPDDFMRLLDKFDDRDSG